MQRSLPSTVLNPVSLIGAVVAIFALVITIILIFLGATGVLANPYTGILSFMLGPGAVALGLLMIPYGALRERRRMAKLGLVAKAFPILDLNDPRQRRGLAIFAAATGGVMAFMAATTWGAAEFMETKEFCGDICHRVMEPEGTAYAAGAHSRVKCVSCHIGPGAPWLVKAKVSGLRQVFNYTFDRFEKPTNAPIKDLRPSRDTCEQCHWPARFYGDQARNFVRYMQDESNTPVSQPLVFRVGGSEQGYGIHWHTTAKVWYLPLDEERSQIGYVRVEMPGGSVEEFALPDKKDEIAAARAQNEQRFMDCIDCHNRAAHSFPQIEDDVDKAMATGTMSPAIPFIKQQAMKAIGGQTAPVSQEQYQQTVQQIDAVEEYYRTEQRELYTKSPAQIKQAVTELRNIYTRIVFPEMNVGPGTYPDWVGHDGCMRCHGKLVGVSGSATGKTISSSCLTCHYPAPSIPNAPSPVSSAPAPQQPSANPILPAIIPHSLDGRQVCAGCHTVGGAGVAAPGGLGIPESHQGRTDQTCLGCHATAQLTGSGARTQTTSASGGVPSAAPPAPAAPASQPAPADPAPSVPPAAQQPPAATNPPGAAPDAAAPTSAAPAAAAPPSAAPAQASGPPAVPHPTQGRDQCSTCHAVGGPGVGASGGLGIPADHQGRTDGTCVACHKGS